MLVTRPAQFYADVGSVLYFVLHIRYHIHALSIGLYCAIHNTCTYRQFTLIRRDMVIDFVTMLVIPSGNHSYFLLNV